MNEEKRTIECICKAAELNGFVCEAVPSKVKGGRRKNCHLVWLYNDGKIFCAIGTEKRKGAIRLLAGSKYQPQTELLGLVITENTSDDQIIECVAHELCYALYGSEPSGPKGVAVS